MRTHRKRSKAQWRENSRQPYWLDGRVSSAISRKNGEKDEASEKLTQYLEIIVKSITVSSAAGIPVGCFLSYTYLNSIGQSSVFTEIISTPASLIAILAVLGLLFLIPFIAFAAPWVIRVNNKDSIELLEDSIKLLKDSIELLKDSIELLDYFKLKIKIFKLKIKIFKLKLERFKLKILINLLSQKSFVVILTMVPFTFISLKVSTWIPDNCYKILFLLFLLFMYILNLWAATNYDKNSMSNAKKSTWETPAWYSVIVLLAICLFASTFSYRILILTRFIESTNDAAWYLLHNDSQKTDGSQEVSGINVEDLKKLKEKFTCSSEKTKSNCFPESLLRAKYRANALYGYMAWNLGSTKVFCPVSFPNDSSGADKHNKKENNSSPCLVINSQYLQPLNARYISSK